MQPNTAVPTSRRDVIIAALKGSMYIAPGVLAISQISHVSALSPSRPMLSVIPPSAPATGPNGRTIFTFSGSGFAPNTTFIYFVEQSPTFIVTVFSVVSDAQGTISGLANPTFTFVPGVYSLSIETSRDGPVLASATFTVT